MSFDPSCHLWPDKNEKYFPDAELIPLLQIGPNCVSTSLGILTCNRPQKFQGSINSQDPTSWSLALQEYGMKLAYCPNDARKLKFYMPELLELDDLFTLSYYTTLDKNVILGDPNAHGWICSSHIVILHRDKIIDPQTGDTTNARDHACNEYHTKRIFRVIPCLHNRGL